MRVYVGSPIDTSLEPPEESFKFLTCAVVDACPGAVIYNPLTAFNNAAAAATQDQLDFVAEINSQALSLADIAVFSWTKSPSFGVPVEIEWCGNTGKPVLVLLRNGGSSPGLYLKRAVNRSDKLSRVVDNKEALVFALKEFEERLEKERSHLD